MQIALDKSQLDGVRTEKQKKKSGDFTEAEDE
jgi:hypothetical protein